MITSPIQESASNTVSLHGLQDSAHTEIGGVKQAYLRSLLVREPTTTIK